MAEPLSISASIAGLVNLAELVLGRVYKYVKDVKNAPKDITVLSTEIGAIYGMLSNLRLLSEQLESDKFQSTIRVHHVYACQQTLEKVISILEKDDVPLLHSQRLGTLKRALQWPFTSSEVKTLVDEIARHKATLILALNADGMVGLLRALSSQHDINVTMNGIQVEMKLKRAAQTRVALNNQRQEVLDSFGRIDPRTNLDMSRKLRHPNTGLWLTERHEFKYWLDNPNARLWLYGIPGAGKTVLASLVIDEMLAQSRPSIAAAYFYCDYKDPMTQEPCRILSCIVQQIAKQDEQSYAKAQNFYESNAHGQRRNVECDPQDLCSLIVSMATDYDCTMIVVDGLDECGENSGSVTEFLVSLSQGEVGVNVKTLFLSRNELDIRECLTDYPTISIAARSSDLRLYVDAEIESRTRKKKLNIKTPELKEYVRNKLVDGAEGMFRWVTCQMDYLCELQNDAARRKALSDLPRGLKPTYERLLRNVNAANNEARKLVQRTWRWLTVNPSLTVEQLCEAVSIDLGDVSKNSEAVPDEREILQYCSSLVRMSADKDRIEFAHFSVEEFLRQIDDVKDAEFASYKIHTQQMATELTQACLTYLNFGEFNHGHSFLAEASANRLDPYVFREFVVEYWCHLGQWLDWENSELFDLATKLFHPSKPDTLISWALDLGKVTNDAYRNRNLRDTLEQGIEEATALHYAAMEGLHDVCSWLIERGCDVNRKSPFGTPLHCALLSRLALLEIDTPTFEDLADRTGYYKDSSTIAVLLQAGADPNICYEVPGGQISPLLIAVRSGWPEEVSRLLLQNGAMVDDNVVDFITEPLKDSVYAGPEFERENILGHAVNANLSDQSRARALQYALEAGTPERTWLMPTKTLAKARHEEIGLCDQVNLLHTAARMGQVEACVKLLDDGGIDVDAPAKSTRMTALLHASMTDQLGVIKMLLKRGANLEKTDLGGRTVLHHCVKARGNRCLSFLLEAGMTTSAKDNQDLTVWHIAALDGNVEALRMLLDDAPSRELSTLSEHDREKLLLCVSQSGSTQATQLLINAGCNAFALDVNGCTALHHAAKAAPPELVNSLISFGLKPDVVTKDGSSTIHFAMMARTSGLSEVLDILLERSVDPFTHRQDKSTPIELLFGMVDGENTDDPDMVVIEKVLRRLAKWPAASRIYQEGLTQALHFTYRTEPSHHPTWLLPAFRLLLDNGASLLSQDLSGRTAFRALSDLWQDECSERDTRPGRDCPVHGAASPRQMQLTDMMTTAVERIPLHGPLHTACKEPSLLRWAIEISDFELGSKLLDHSPNVDEHINNNEEISPIRVACRVGCSRALFRKLLSKSKAISDKKLGSYLSRIVCQQSGENQTDMLSELLEAGVDHHQPSGEGYTALHFAASTGTTHMVKMLLSHGSNIKSTNHDGWNAAHCAMNHVNCQDMICLLRDTDVDWDARCDVSWSQLTIRNISVLHHAALVQNQHILQYLLDENLVQDIDAVAERDETALFLAALRGDPGNVSVLLKNGANPAIMVKRDALATQSPIHVAAASGYSKVVEEFIKYNCDLAMPDAQGLTSEMIALKHGHEETAKLLGEHVRKKAQNRASSPIADSQVSSQRVLSTLRIAIEIGDLELCQSIAWSGVDLDRGYHDCNLCTPLLYSLYKRQRAISKHIASRGASPVGVICCIENPWGYSAFHLAAEDNHVELLRILITSQADQYRRLAHSVHPLHIALLCEAGDFVRLLLANAEEDAQTLVNRPVGNLVEKSLYNEMLWDATPLQIAILTHNLELAKLLLQSGSLVNLSDSYHRSPLHIAASRGDSEMTTLLLEFGANPSAQNSWLETPAMLAADKGSETSIKALLTGGADLNVKDICGQTALHHATTRGHLGLMLYIMANTDWMSNTIEDKLGDSLFIAAFKWGEDHFTALLNMVPSPKFYSDAESNILIAAVVNRDITARVVKMIIERIPQDMRQDFLSFRDPFYGTPLYAAVTSTTATLQASIINILLDAGADLEADGGDHGTALMGACAAGRLAAVKLLVQRGARMVYTKGDQTYSALRAAKHFPDVIHWLLVGRHIEGPKLLTLGASS